jgi:hypothetical protein
MAIGIIIVLLLLVGILAVNQYYAGQQKPAPEKFVVIGTTLDAGTNLDPAQDQTYGIMMLNLNVFDTLYGLQPDIYPDAKLEPRLAYFPVAVQSRNVKGACLLHGI